VQLLIQEGAEEEVEEQLQELEEGGGGAGTTNGPSKDFTSNSRNS
jgi:hypothetical protein